MSIGARAERGGGRLQEKRRKKAKGSQYDTRIQTECIERFRGIKSRSLGQTNTSINITKSSRIITIN